MIYNEDKPSGFGFPLIVIVLAIAAMLVGLAMTSVHTPSARVFVPSSASAPEQ